MIGTKTKMETRLDIEILAKDINAVNIQIHGDVNMKVLGDWYVHHEGNKHETHIGTHYVKHIGDTVIEEEGEHILRRTGNTNRFFDGDFNEEITGSRDLTILADSTKNIGNCAYERIGGDFDQFIGGYAGYKIVNDEKREVGNDYDLKIGRNKIETVRGNYEFVAGGEYNLKANENVEVTSKNGNIDLKTLGLFELMGTDGNITPAGYSNIGTRGNINLTSTFGNIGINTVENELVADFKKEYTCIAWNPMYLKQMALLSNILPDLDINEILKPAKIDTSLTGIFNFLKKAALFDGFPAYLPCKMIMQNPNITATDEPTDALKMFRSIDDDWTNITNTNYWKLISNVMGNIDIKSWSGNINVVTSGTLGNAGNINILANNKHGGLPGYTAGNVNIKANTPFRVYSDPRDLFLDTHLVGKLMGKFAWFNTATESNTYSPPAITEKPFEEVQAILSLLGLNVEFGFASDDNKEAGCKYCISDALYQAATDLKLFQMVPYTLTKKIFEGKCPPHKFNSLKPSFADVENDLPGGSTSILNSKSNGYAHAVDEFGLDSMYNNRYGMVTVDGVGTYQLNAGKNIVLKSYSNKWNFGVSSVIETDWIEPSETIIPSIEESITQLPILNYVCEPFYKSYKRDYLNKMFDYSICEISCEYKGIKKSGVYNIAEVKNGVLGTDTGKFIVNIPGMNFTNVSFNLKNSTSLVLNNKPYDIVYGEEFDNILDFELSTDNDNDKVNNDEFDSSLDIELSTDNDIVINNEFESSVVDQPILFKSLKTRSVNAGSETGEYDDIIDEDGDINEEMPDIDSMEDVELINGFEFSVGDDSNKSGVSGLTKYVKLKEQLPATADAINLALPIIQVLKPLIPGIGDSVYQAAKMIPDLPVIDISENFTKMGEMLGSMGKSKYNAFGLTDIQISGGCLSILSSKPMLYNLNKIGLPDFASLADELLSQASEFNPVDALIDLISEDLPSAMANIELNTTIGQGMFKPIADALDIEDLLSTNFGLHKDAKFKFTKNILDSEEDRKVEYTDITVDLPLKLDESFMIEGETYLLKSGIGGSIEVGLTDLNAKLKVDLIDETLKATIGGLTDPTFIFTACNCELFHIGNDVSDDEGEGDGGSAGGGSYENVMGADLFNDVERNDDRGS